MDFITTSLPDVIAMSMSQSPGYLAPAFTVTRLPHAAAPSEAWLNRTPSAATFTVDGVTWACVCQSSDVAMSMDGGVVIEEQYYPQVIAVLQHGGFAKHLVFLSCPDAVAEKLIDQYDEDEYEVLHQACDVYTSNGWTVNAILAEIGRRANVAIQSALPELHVPQPTVMIEKGKRLLDSIRSLLPNEVTLLWQTQGNVLVVDYVRPATTLGIPPDAIDLKVSRSHTPPFTMAQITGGETLPTATIALGGSSVLGASSSTRDKTVQDTQQTDDAQVDRTYTTDPDGNLFALQQQITTRAAQTQSTVLTETFAYDNLNAELFRVPRQQQRVAVETGQIVALSSGVTGGANQAILMSDGAIRTLAEMNALPAQNRPSILLVAYQTDGERERVTETFEYISQAAASRDWPEGTQRRNQQTIQRACCQVNGNTYLCTGSPADVLQQIAAGVAAKYPEDTWTSGHVSNRVNTTLRDVETVTRRVEYQSGGAYRFVESISTLGDTQDENGAAGRAVMQTQTNITTIDADRLPSNPTQYRTQPLRATLNWDGGAGVVGEGWSSSIVYPFEAQIPTNNPDDFAAWAAIIWRQATTPRAAISFTTNSTFYAIGERVAGMTITACQVSINEDREVSLSFSAE